jgi:hypothetical protein
MKIAFINVYFGKWPMWFPAFLQSCRHNPSVNWFLFTDCPIPETTLENVKFIPFTMAEFNALASRKLDLDIQLSFPRKVCDFKSAFGVLFEEYLQGFDFWGHCDIDIIWGDIRSFVTESILQESQVISGCNDRVVGHCTLWKNEPQVNELFKFVPEYREILTDRQYRNLDETVMTRTLKTIVNADGSTNKVRVYWAKRLVAGGHILEDRPKGWSWERGKILRKNSEEYMYLHFISWKKTMVNLDFQLEDNPSRFDIRHRGIWSRNPSPIESFLEETQLVTFLYQTYKYFDTKFKQFKSTTRNAQQVVKSSN